MRTLLFFFYLAFTAVFSWSQSVAGVRAMGWEKPKDQIQATKSGNDRSDTLDVLHTNLYLDMTQMTAQQIEGACTITFRSKMDNISVVHLDLLELQVDSVHLAPSGAALTYSYNSPSLFISLPTAVQTGDEFTLTVYYSGSPTSDATWGGFYFSLGYAYNMGVGFDADPHNFGRAWYPCFDNFVERSSFDLSVLTTGNRRAFGAGVKLSEEEIGQDSTLVHWQLQEPIPSYLTSIAVSDYHVLRDSVIANDGLGYDGSGYFPISLVARAVDTTEMRASFEPLGACFQHFENQFGPYEWPRIGFTAVPFNGGAMEHATNIAYPRFAIDGTLNYETLLAHELSHHWWGNNTTCRTAEDMWLNEGWASFCEAIYLEGYYGADAYTNYIKDTHKNVLLYAHLDDGARYPVSPVPHEVTYGTHVYQKGAIMASVLRHYMGDSAFFLACKDFISAHAFSDVSSYDLRDFFQNYTAENLTDFFDHWIFAPGYPSFRVNSFEQNGQSLTVETEHRPHYGPDNYGSVPIELTVRKADGSEHQERISIDSPFQTHTLNLPSDETVEAVYLNGNYSLSQAVLGENHVYTAPEEWDFDYAECSLSLENAMTNYPLWVRIENHWSAAATPAFIPFTDYFISPDRWWQVMGNLPDQGAELTLPYSGNQALTNANLFDPQFFAYIDQENLTENDLIVLYQPDGLSPWVEWSDFSIQTVGSSTNFSGRIVVQHARSGRYAWAVKTGTIHVDEKDEPSSTLEWMDAHSFRIHQFEGELTLLNSLGQIQRRENYHEGQVIDISTLATGNYFLRMNTTTFSIVKIP
jgi:hypothetical protein